MSPVRPPKIVRALLIWAMVPVWVWVWLVVGRHLLVVAEKFSDLWWAGPPLEISVVSGVLFFIIVGVIGLAHAGTRLVLSRY